MLNAYLRSVWFACAAMLLVWKVAANIRVCWDLTASLSFKAQNLAEEARAELLRATRAQIEQAKDRCSNCLNCSNPITQSFGGQFDSFFSLVCHRDSADCHIFVHIHMALCVESDDFGRKSK